MYGHADQTDLVHDIHQDVEEVDRGHERAKGHQETQSHDQLG